MRSVLLLICLWCCCNQALVAQKGNFHKVNGFELSDLLIPRAEIFHGGPPKDGIPAIDYPKFILGSKAKYINPTDQILGLYLNGIAKAYPISILNYHEIVNDDFKGQKVVVTYCPLCGSGVAFDANINGEALSFGVSGLLYNSDVLMYDRESASLWSQLLSKAISGEKSGQELEMLLMTNTTWQAWFKEHPETLLLSRETGYKRDYNKTPYTGYEQNPATIFPVKNSSKKFGNKVKVLGLSLNGQYKAYPFTRLKKLKEALQDEFAGETVTITYDKKNKTAKVFNEQGKELPVTVLYWFAWYAFHPDTQIFKPK